MNEDGESKVLADAIAALQSRVKELEEANGAFRRESALLRLKLNGNMLNSSENEANLLAKADDTAQQLASTAETLRTLRIIKKENRNLEREYEEMEQTLGKYLRENTEFSQRMSKLEHKIRDAQELQYEYDKMMLEMFTPETDNLKNVKLNVTFISSAISKETFSMPANLQILLQELRTLPPNFSTQKQSVKVKIIDALNKAKERIEMLNFELENLKKENKGKTAQKRCKPIIESKLNCIAALSNAMKRFQICDLADEMIM